MKKITLLFSLILLVVSCKDSGNSEQNKTDKNTTTESPENTKNSFNEAGLSFSFPSDWYISDFEDYNENSFYASAERRGENESGLATFSWVNGDTVTDYMASHIEGLMAYGSDIKNLEVGDKYDTDVNGMPAEGRDYSMSVDDKNHIGRLRQMRKNGRTLIILEQEALEDTTKNKQGFDMIESSLNFK